MPANLLNHHVLMSGAEYFDDSLAINAYMDAAVSVDRQIAAQEHQAIKLAFEQADIQVTQVPAPPDCQDGVYTANWGLCRGDKVVLAALPNQRQAEEAYAAEVFGGLGKQVVRVPKGLKFSGQGDALPVGNILLAGSQYRTDQTVHQFLADHLGYEVIGLQTIPLTDAAGQPQINPVTGWPDSFFYDLDLAVAVISPDLIAWCPDAFLPASQDKIAGLPLQRIEVSLEEAQACFACNLVSTGQTVIMSDRAPELKRELADRGLNVITPHVTELAKGGGFIRCTSLTLE